MPCFVAVSHAKLHSSGFGHGRRLIAREDGVVSRVTTERMRQEQVRREVDRHRLAGLREIETLDHESFDVRAGRFCHRNNHGCPLVGARPLELRDLAGATKPRVSTTRRVAKVAGRGGGRGAKALTHRHGFKTVTDRAFEARQLSPAGSRSSAATSKEDAASLRMALRAVSISAAGFMVPTLPRNLLSVCLCSFASCFRNGA